ncbi:DegV family protein [uncultured Parolsenella sp.]|uniref:DegV family protein n=1 Tax=uncultured Parolsenella sp. TaxID=2083008 RepID=UPI0027DB594E|nr:DegV family protein [uncultured Parolsenella sp.]
MAVRIITDSASDITREDVAAAGNPALTVLPLSVTFGNTTYEDGVNLSHQRFYELLVEGDDLPMTGQVNPYAFERAIGEARAAGDDVIVITLSGKLSGTNASANTAAASFDSGVYVVDSKNVTVGERVLVDYALRLVGEGLSAADIATALEQAREDIYVVGLLDTLEYLRRGGRIPASAAALGKLLSIKPVITIEDGAVELLGKARGSKNGRNLLTQQVETAGGIDFAMPIALGYAGLDGALLRKYIEDSRHIWEDHIALEDLPVHSVGATIGTHVGPGAIALAFFKQR